MVTVGAGLVTSGTALRATNASGIERAIPNGSNADWDIGERHLPRRVEYRR